MPKKYLIQPILWRVADEDSVRFHVENDDYFGTIATVLSLLEQDIDKNGGPSAAVFKKILKNLEKDLMFLQRHYHIKPNKRKRNISPKGRLRSQ